MMLDQAAYSSCSTRGQGVVRFGAFVVFGLVSLGIAAIVWAALGPLDYQLRTDRFEGVHPKPISGYGIELLGAMVESPRLASLPETLSLSFFLPDQEAAFIIVRERAPRKYYWLDRLYPNQWRGGSTNVFRWPTSEVLRPLGLTTSELVALARLGSDAPQGHERVAPVFLGEASGSEVRAYRFTLKLRSTSMLSYRLYGPGMTEPILSEPRRRREGRAPFQVRWSAEGAPDGLYRLVFEGFALEGQAPVDLIVDFYHLRRWPG